ncbi:BTAD domain-containing putative transcriptional regulator [Streptomyces sp. NPDC090045]|uniref:AfsR/SARP family transcriptional regulator n=1 Tax=Streptomyces sp. NPDC090045 TaxID=3365927 RepID=UPI0038027F9C
MTLDGMRFRILGGLEWHLDGVSLQIGRRRERILLGLLLLDIGRTVPAGRLVELLWADGSAPSSARSSMQVHVSRLRSRLLEAGAHQHGFVLSMADGGYALSGEEMAVDVHRFRCSLQEAEQTDDPARRLRHLARAFAEWGGPVLAGTAPEPLVRRLGAAYDELHLSAITQRAEARLALGQWSTMLEELARAAAEHPHHERLTALRMVALYRSDRRGEALRVYDETRTGLVRELGLDPGEELRRLHRVLPAHRPARGAARDLSHPRLRGQSFRHQRLDVPGERVLNPLARLCAVYRVSRGGRGPAGGTGRPGGRSSPRPRRPPPGSRRPGCGW